MAAFKRLSLGLGLILLAATILLVSDSGSRRKSKSVANGQTQPKVWKVRILEYVNVADVEEAERGVFDGLREAGLEREIADSFAAPTHWRREAGLERDKDFEAKVLNAQGDMATLNSLVDAAMTDQADLIITLSTPTLQAAAQRAGKTPIVFTFLASPQAAGVAKSDTDHKPNLTGSYGGADADGMIALLPKVMPKARRIGVLSTPGEVNAIYNYDLIVKAAKASGYELETVGMNGPSEVADAALALCSKQVDLLCIPNSNLVASSFPSIAKAARQAKLPIFGFFGSMTKQGALLALSRDYYDMGHEGGLLAARVIRGELPANLPLKPATQNRLLINQDVAKTLGITISDELLKAAESK